MLCALRAPRALQLEPGRRGKREKAQGKVGEKEKGQKYRENRGGEGKTEK